MAALALEIEHRIHQMLHRLGSGDLAVLGHMPHQQQRRAAGLGIADQIETGGADLGDGARRRIQRPGPQRLDGIDGDDGGGPILPFERARFQRGENVFDTGGRAQHQRRVGQPHAGGAHTHLRHRLLARDIDGMAAILGILAQRLQDDGGLADARIAADQQRRSRHQPAAGDAVELRDAGGAAFGRGVMRLEVFQGDLTAF